MTKRIFLSLGWNLKRILIISSDVKSYKEMQTNTFCLPKPCTIVFEKIGKQMLVEIKKGFAHLYDISY